MDTNTLLIILLLLVLLLGGRARPVRPRALVLGELERRA